MKNSNLVPYQFLEKLKNISIVEKIILYGSRARKNNKKKSDIDLALVCPKAKSSDWLSILEVIEKADTLLKIDCVRLDHLKEDNPLKKAILQEGIVLYEKESHE